MAINIVYALTRNVYEWILPSIKSLVKYNKDVRIFILAEDDELPFELLTPVEVINVSGQKYFTDGSVNYNNIFTYINLLKVRYPTLLPVDKVIHLDIDTIVCDSLDDMFNADLHGKWFGAVPEYNGKYKPFGDVYYNMGVAVINLDQMRKDGIEQVMQDYLNSVSQPWADQDAWNKYGLENSKIVEIDTRYNESPVTDYTDNPAIVHYCSIRNWFTNRDMFRVEYLDKYRNSTPRMRVLVAVPTYENIYPDTFRSIFQLYRGGHEVDFDFFRGYDVANARNQIARATIERGYDYVLMVDNDEVLPKDALLNLLETEQGYPRGHSMVIGYCLSRPANSPNMSGRTIAFKFNGRDYLADDAYTAEEFEKLKKEGQYRVQIRGAGLGCALIHRSIFEKMTYPYFKWVLYDNGSQLSEDLFFSEKFKEIKTPIFVDTRVVCGHLMRYIGWPV